MSSVPKPYVVSSSKDDARHDVDRPMDFGISTEQEALNRAARRFAVERLKPLASTCDRNQSTPTDLYREAHALGILSGTVPEAWGGAGVGPLSSALLAEILGWACTGLQATLFANHLSIVALASAGTGKQKERWLRRLALAPILASFCSTEAHGGSDPSGIRTRAIRDGSGFRLVGEKAWITNATLASFYIILATVDPDAGRDGLAAFVVDRAAPGVTVLPAESKLGHRASDTACVRFDEVRLAADDMIAPPGQGFFLAMRVFDCTRPEVAAAATGLAQRCLDESLAVCEQRHAFGRPIGEHQLVQSLLADMVVGVETSRLAYQKAAFLVERGERATKAASVAKLHATHQAMKAALDAVQIHGAMGISTQLVVEKLLRDAKVMQIYEGTSEIQRLVIAREARRDASKGPQLP